MHKNIFTAVLKGFFTVVYFLVFLFFIGRIFSHTLSAFTRHFIGDVHDTGPSCQCGAG